MDLTKVVAKILNGSGVRYCILHDWETVTKGIPSDLDIVVHPDDMWKFRNYLTAMEDPSLVQVLQHEATSFHFYLYLAGRGKFISLDVSSDYRHHGFIFFCAERLMVDRRRWHGLWVAAPQVEFSYLLVKRIFKGNFLEKHKQKLAQLQDILEVESESICQKLLGEKFGPKLDTWITAGDWAKVLDHLPSLRRQLKNIIWLQDFTNPVRFRLAEFRRGITRLRYPTGLSCVFLGPDGAGKSSVIAEFSPQLTMIFRGQTQFHLMPRLRPASQTNAPETRPHAKQPRSIFGSLAKLLFFAFRYWLGWGVVWWKRNRSHLIIFDRYYHDILVDPIRYRYGGPMWIANMIGRLIPQPDLFILLDAPAEVLQSRVQEVPFSETVRQRENYREFIIIKSHGYIIDASRSLIDVTSNVNEVILNFLAARQNQDDLAE